MSQLVSSIYISNRSTFSSVDQLTKGRIKCGYTLLNKFSDDELQRKIKVIYFAISDHKHQSDKLENQHCFLYLEDKNFNFYKLELECTSCGNDQLINLKKRYFGIDIIHEEQYSKKTKNSTLKDIIIYIQDNFKNTAYNSLTNDCSKFCFDIIQAFCIDPPEHIPVCEKLVNDIYFCISPIKISGKVINHGYIIVTTETKDKNKTITDYWRFEIGGCKDRVILNMSKCESSDEIKYVHIAKEVKKVKIGDIIKKSEQDWGNTYYQTVSNNCFDYCKFIMRNFTNKPVNELAVKNVEHHSFLKGGLVISNVAVSSLYGFEVGSIAGPVGSILGGIVGGVLGGVCSIFASKI